MCGSSDEPEEAQPTAADIAEMNSASIKQWQYDRVFKPLEQTAIDEATPENRAIEQARFRGAASADVAQAEAQAGQGTATAVGQGLGALTLRGAAGDAAVAQSQSLGEADKLAQTRFTDKKTSIVSTGRGLSRISDQGLRQSQQNAESKAVNKLQNDQITRESKLAAVTSVLNSGLKAGMVAKGNYDASQKKKAYESGTDQIDAPQGYSAGIDASQFTQRYA